MKNKLWGGRFSKKTHPLVEEFTKSIQFDKKLAEYDCIGSLCHIRVLKKAKLLSNREYEKLNKGLKEIFGMIGENKLKIEGPFEDIHSYIQHILEEKTGKAALKLHTCRSRNDQVAFDTKLYCSSNILLTIDIFSNLIEKISSSGTKLIVPGYTHMQHAVPVGLSSYFGAYVEMFTRDIKRLKNSLGNIGLTMGSGAIAGTFIEAEKYKNKDITAPSNSIDTVSNRDFVIEILSTLAITGMHLSRLAEDLILWSTKEFDFIDIDESFCTGSSLMPHKKNPDVLELIRGNTGRLYGNLMSVLVMMKGLPLAYNRDMQLDKEPLFNSFEIIQNELKILAELLPKIKFKKENIARQLEDECLYATDMVDFLVKNKIPFKEAHTIIGKLVKYRLSSGKEIKKMSNEELKKFHPLLTQKVMKKIIDPATSVRSKKSVRKNARKV
jgi:argininosuccinate lyase